MDEERLLRTRLEKAVRDARNAENEMLYRKQQAKDQQKHLQTLVDYREECISGLKSASESGLTIVQMREYQLLMQHLGTVVEEQQYKVDISQQNFEQAEQQWNDLQQHREQLQKRWDAFINDKMEQEVGGESDPADKNRPAVSSRSAHSADDRLAGKRLRTGRG